MTPRSGPKPAGPPPRQRRPYAPRLPPAARREQLLDAALGVIVELGYGGVSIEAIARKAGVTRPVVYDHFTNLGTLLHALIEREERYSLAELDHVIPPIAVAGDPVLSLAESVRRFLDAVASRPDTWRVILLPPEGTPELVRSHVAQNRERILERIGQLVRAGVASGGLPRELDIELAARALRDLGEEAGRMVLTQPERFSPERYERFVQTIMQLIWTHDGGSD